MELIKCRAGDIYNQGYLMKNVEVFKKQTPKQSRSSGKQTIKWNFYLKSSSPVTFLISHFSPFSWPHDDSVSQTWHWPRWQINIVHLGDLLILKANVFQSQHWERSSSEKVVQSNLRTHKPVSWPFVTTHVPWDYRVPREFHHLHRVNATVYLNNRTPKHTTRPVWVPGDGEDVTFLKTAPYNGTSRAIYLVMRAFVHFAILPSFKRGARAPACKVTEVC